MKSLVKFFILFFTILFLSTPIFAQEEVKEAAAEDLEELIPLKAEELEEGVITGEVTSASMKEPKLVKVESRKRYQRLIDKDLGSVDLESGHVTL